MHLQRLPSMFSNVGDTIIPNGRLLLHWKSDQRCRHRSDPVWTGHSRRHQFVQCALPCDRHVFVRDLVIGQGMSKPSPHFELIIAPLYKLCNCVGDKKFERTALCLRLSGHGFGAVLTKLEARRMLWVRPCAAWAIEAGWLVHAQQRRGSL